MPSNWAIKPLGTHFMSFWNWFKISLNETEIFYCRCFLSAFSSSLARVFSSHLKSTSQKLDYILIKFHLIKFFTHSCKRYVTYMLCTIMTSFRRRWKNGGGILRKFLIILKLGDTMIPHLKLFPRHMHGKSNTQKGKHSSINHFDCDWSFYIFSLQKNIMTQNSFLSCSSFCQPFHTSIWHSLNVFPSLGYINFLAFLPLSSIYSSSNEGEHKSKYITNYCDFEIFIAFL